MVEIYSESCYTYQVIDWWLKQIVQGKGYEKIALTTFGFQAPEFYKKLGYELEFVREDKDPKLSKYFYIKRIWEGLMRWIKHSQKNMDIDFKKEYKGGNRLWHQQKSILISS